MKIFSIFTNHSWNYMKEILCKFTVFRSMRADSQQNNHICNIIISIKVLNSNESDILKIELKWAHRILIGYKQGLACFSLVVAHPRQFLSSVIYWCDAPGVLMCAPWTFWRTKPRFWVDTEWIRIEHSSKCLYHQNSSKWANDATVILIENNAPIYIKTYNITHSSY